MALPRSSPLARALRHNSFCTPTSNRSETMNHTNGALPRVDEHDLWLDQFRVLLSSESAYAVRHVRCLAQHSRRPVSELEEWRRKICQWSFRVIDHFRLDRETVSLGMNIFDRFLLNHRRDEYSPCPCPCPSCKRVLDSRTYQLAAMTALYLAIKLHSDTEQGRKRSFKLENFVELSRGQFVVDDICKMEQTILATVQWKVHPPTPMVFVTHILAVFMPPTGTPRFDLVLHVVRELSRYMTELAVCMGRECSCHSSSQVAFSAILSSMDLLTTSAIPTNIRQQFTNRVSGMIGPPHPMVRATVQKALWPELLLDCDDDARHPIAMARDFGLLDIDRIYVETPPVSPKRSFSLHESPVSVNR